LRRKVVLVQAGTRIRTSAAYRGQDEVNSEVIRQIQERSSGPKE